MRMTCGNNSSKCNSNRNRIVTVDIIILAAVDALFNEFILYFLA